jgi:outer membrane lipoprotein-sorting protein
MGSGLRKIVLCLGLGMMLPAGLHAQGGDAQKILQQLDAASAKFQSATADFTWDQVQTVVNEHEIQTGTVYYQRKKATTQVAAYIQKDNGKDAPKIVTFNGEEARYYVPAIKQVTLIKAGANGNQWQSFLTLGFGGSGKELDANWKVADQGADTLDGVHVEKLDLVPKEKSVADMFNHVTIWIDLARGLSLKQVFYEPSGDTRTATYKNIRYNTPVASSVFDLKLPKDVTTIVK